MRASSALKKLRLETLEVTHDHTRVSTIVPEVEVVSTPRSDVEVVVTEHGVADLRGAGDAERARRLTAIAAPVHREALASAAGGRRS